MSQMKGFAMIKQKKEAWNIWVSFIRYLRVGEEKLPQHPVFGETQIRARWHHFLHELLHRIPSRFALLSCQHFGLVVWSKNQSKGFCIKPQLEHQQFSLFTQFILCNTRTAVSCISQLEPQKRLHTFWHVRATLPPPCPPKSCHYVYYRAGASAQFEAMHHWRAFWEIASWGTPGWI